MKTSKDFDDKMKELTAGVLSANSRKESNIDTGIIDTAALLLDVAELHTLQEKVTALEEENDLLNNKLDQASKEINELKSKIKHNARNAGRHRLSKTEKFKDFCKLKKENCSRECIMQTLDISNRSYFNYLKEYKLTL